MHRARILSDAPTMAWINDGDGRGVFVNQQWLRFTGRPLEQELAEGWIDTVHPYDHERVLGIQADALAARRPFRVDFRACRADRVYRYQRAAGVPPVGRADTFDGSPGTRVDVTDARQGPAVGGRHRIVIEAPENINRHARARTTWIYLTRQRAVTLIDVRDNGRGITRERVNNPHAMGLLAMRERALALGGEVRITAALGHGTRLLVILPGPHAA